MRKTAGVASHAFELKEFDNKAAYEEAIVHLLNEHQIDLDGLYENCWPNALAAYEGRIINIHLAYLLNSLVLMVLRMLGIGRC